MNEIKSACLWKLHRIMRSSEMNEGQNDAGKVVLLLTTFPDKETARQIGTIWIESQLAACVNILPGVESIYRWKGGTERSEEVQVIVKTVCSRLPKLEASLRELHPYELPEVLVLFPESGSEEFFAWIRSETMVDKSES